MRNTEVDFVATRKNQTIYIQVAYILENEETYAREYGALQTIPDNYEKMVVTLDDVIHPDFKGIKHVQVWKLDLR